MFELEVSFGGGGAGLAVKITEERVQISQTQSTADLINDKRVILMHMVATDFNTFGICPVEVH